MAYKPLTIALPHRGGLWAGALRCAFRVDDARILAVPRRRPRRPAHLARGGQHDVRTAPVRRRHHAVATQGKRFGWISATRSTVLQPGPVHGGSVAEPEAEVERLLDRLRALGLFRHAQHPRGRRSPTAMTQRVAWI